MIRLLIVDDDMLTRKYLTETVRWQDYGIGVVGEAVHGKQALEQIHATGPDVAIVDVSMPVMDGIELVHRISESNLEVSVIMLSCLDEIDLVKNAMKHGACDYIFKNDAEEDVLARAIKKAVAEAATTGNTERVSHSRCISSAVNFVASHYTEQINTMEVADHVGLSRSYFSQLFHHDTGKTFTQFVRGFRIEKAKALLRETSLRVYQVAEAVGFTNQYYFCRAFRREVGFSPSAFREADETSSVEQIVNTQSQF
jgi:two-component system sensor histidine kinase YesM